MVKSNTPIRRTKSIQQTIEANTEITALLLGSTRSQSIIKPIKRSIKPLKKSKDIKKTQPLKKTTDIKKTQPLKKTAEVKKTQPIKKTAEVKKTQPLKKTAEVKKNAIQIEKINANVPRRSDSKATAGIVDVVFCVDTTSSMGTYIVETKQTVQTIVRNILEKSQDESISVRFGFVCYRDHPPEDSTYVTRVKDLCSETEVLKFIGEQTATGGGDYPEAVLDGLFAAAEMISWRNNRSIPSLRYIFHIADAPPHGEEFGFPSKWSKGVPSGVTMDMVTHAINIREIHYRLINLRTQQLQKMAEIFKANFSNYDETSLYNANQLNIKVTDMIIHELMPDTINE